MEQTEIIQDVNKLTSSFTQRKRKYTRNARVYYQSNLILDNNQLYQIPGYQDLNPETKDNNIPGLTENVAASCVDTLVSQVAAQKVRPSFVTVDGDWRDVMSTRMCQHFFDLYFDRQNINTVVTEVFNDACIFDTGYIYLDHTTNDIYRVAPWKVYYDPNEEAIGEKTKILLYFKNYPTSLLKKYDGKESVCEYVRYYNIKTKTYAEIINNKVVKQEKWEKEILPVLDMKYSLEAVSGGYSLIDRLFGIQITINGIARTIYTCLKRNMAQTFFVPEGTFLNENQLNNRIGNIYEFSNHAGQPVVVATPAPYDRSYMQDLQQLKQDAYAISGVSFVAARGDKPTGLDSGKALEAFESQQDARFQTQINRIIRLYTAIAYSMIKIFDENEDILPDYDFKWKDVIKANNRFKIQYAVQSSISKSPEQKLQYIQSLMDSGWIDRQVGATMLDIPDTEKATSISTNVINAISKVIDDCIENDNFEIPFYIPSPELKKEIRNTILSTVGCNKKDAKEIVEKLTKLYENCMKRDMVMEIQEQEENQQIEEEKLNKNMEEVMTQAQVISNTGMDEGVEEETEWQG